MATTFDVISLGKLPLMDNLEGDITSSGAYDLIGLSFGSGNDPLYNYIQTFSPAGSGYDGGQSNLYDTNNLSSNDQFSINDGPPQTFDSVAVFYADLIYTDGTVASITAVVFQDTDGNTYLAPEYSDNLDTEKLGAKPIETLYLDWVAVSTDAGLIADRVAADFMVCFARGTKIDTLSGSRRIEDLKEGDLVLTQDRGAQPIRWIGAQTRTAKEGMMVDIAPGALGANQPSRPLRVSRQHRVLLRSRVAERMFGQAEVLIAAHQLVGLEGITFAELNGEVEFWHLLFDQHELVSANGALTESLLMGKQARKQIGPTATRQIAAIDQGLLRPAEAARFIPSNKQQKKLIARIAKNGKPLLEKGLPVIQSMAHSA